MRCYSGKGLLNTVINNLGFEAHLPGGYRYCGPGTRLKERLARGDKPINKLDGLCLKHDLFYDREKETTKRHEADKILAEGALQRFKSQDASFGERLAGLAVAGAMKAKVKLGMGLKQPSCKQLMRRCLKAMETSKKMSENSVKRIQDGINIIKNHKFLNRPPSLTQRKVKNKKRKENVNIINNHPEHLPMEIEFNRKRKIDDNHINSESLLTKKSRISIQQRPRKVGIAARRRREQSQKTLNMAATDTLLNLNTPINITGEKRKRKLQEDESDNDSSDTEPYSKFIKTE